MIKFFRRIRQNLLSRGKTGKYLKYAIGEIVLIVIGIVIALQISNWNNQRLQRIEEVQLLTNLKTDFQSIIDQFEYLNGLRRNLIDVTEKITNMANGGASYPTTVLDSLFMHTFYSPTFNTPTGSFEVLFSSNKINLISNNELKNRLMAWPGELEDMKEEENYENNLFRNKYLPLLYDDVSFANIIAHFKISDLNFNLTGGIQGINPSGKIISNYKALFDNNRFLNVLHLRVIHSTISRHETELLIEKAKTLIKLIENDLKP